MTATKPADKRNPRDGEICAQSNGVICIFVFFLVSDPCVFFHCLVRVGCRLPRNRIYSSIGTGRSLDPWVNGCVYTGQPPGVLDGWVAC